MCWQRFANRADPTEKSTRKAFAAWWKPRQRSRAAAFTGAPLPETDVESESPSVFGVSEDQDHVKPWPVELFLEVLDPDCMYIRGAARSSIDFVFGSMAMIDCNACSPSTAWMAACPRDSDSSAMPLSLTRHPEPDHWGLFKWWSPQQ